MCLYCIFSNACDRYKLKPEYPYPPSRPQSQPSTPPSTPTSGDSSGNLPLEQRRAKRAGWVREIKPHERVSLKAERQMPSYEASARAYEEGKEHGKSYRKAKKERRRTAEIYVRATCSSFPIQNHAYSTDHETCCRGPSASRVHPQACSGTHDVSLFPHAEYNS